MTREELEKMLESYIPNTGGDWKEARAPKHSVSSYPTYEDALEAGLIEALKLIM